ncbi:MAG: NAD-dependent epimerase/dehydratase family protein [Planctomycetes bacterium]|nr:NAD-dependent epimerase/dehydratase family protein [Planctomycetota bacterium]
MLTLVTGATGFLGRYIVEQLVSRGDRVRGLMRRDDPQLAALGVEQCLGDVRDAHSVEQACAGVDLVFHTAAIAGIWGRWTDFYQTNIRGTEHVLSGCRRHNVPRLVFTSSPSVTFDGGDQSGIDESAPYPTRWLAHYPHTKALAEQAVLTANSPTLSTCALRPHLIWGPRDRHLVPRLIERARAGQLRRIGAGNNVIDMIYVENAARAHLQAADALIPASRVAGQAYFLSQGSPVNCWGWINELLALAGLPPVRRSVPVGVAYAAGALLEAIAKLTGSTSEPRMTRFLALQLARDHYFALDRARRDFGYQATVSTAEGMERLRASMKQRA